MMRTAIVYALLGSCLYAAAAPASSLTTASSVTVLFHNNGNWTNHALTPSALFINEASTYNDAVQTCASYGEKLLDCSQFGAFIHDLTYQQYLHSTNGPPLFWSSCHAFAPTSVQGVVRPASASSSAGTLELPFLCTNTAPFVSQVDTDYSTFPRVTTASIAGTAFEGLRDHMAFRFLGIPFAKPPVGNLRFQYAQAPTYDGDTVNATQYGPACLQFGSFDGNSQGLNPWGNSENCLHLQVFTPSLPVGRVPSKGLKPVMFWMHGGGMVNGVGSDSTFDGDSLVSRGDVVVVTINYRLNIFGLLSLDDGVIPGNYGVSDKIAALEWVKKYIAAFGGDPDNITIFGQSAGAASVMDLVVSPKAKGLFQGAIAQSIGGEVVNQSTAAARILPSVQQLCKNSTGEARLECLQAIPAETLLNASSNASAWQTVIDHVYMTDQPVSLVSQGIDAINPINFLIGYMPEEAQSLLQTEVAPNISDFNIALDILIQNGQINQSQANAIEASGLWKIPEDYNTVYNATVNIGTDTDIVCYAMEFVNAGAPSDAYKSLWVYAHQRAYALSYYSFYDLCSFPVGKPDTPYYRCHSGDLYEVFGTYYIFDQPIRVPEDIYYTNAVQDMWASFARTGNPNPPKEYLSARGYESSVEFFGTFTFDQYKGEDGVANLQWPAPFYAGLPYQDKCAVLGIDVESS
jgi:carboxylesterase type B